MQELGDKHKVLGGTQGKINSVSEQHLYVADYYVTAELVQKRRKYKCIT